MRLLASYVLCLMCLCQLPLAWATDQAYPIITYSCDYDKDILKIKNEVKWGEAGKNFDFSSENGTYNPWDWVKIIDRKGRQLISQSKTVELSCKLSGVVFRVQLEPKLFNPDFNGSCGDKLSAKVSIYAGEQVLLKDKELEQFCRGNAAVIRGIKVFGKNRKVKLYEIPKHKFY